MLNYNPAVICMFTTPICTRSHIMPPPKKCTGYVSVGNDTIASLNVFTRHKHELFQVIVLNLLISAKVPVQVPQCHSDEAQLWTLSWLDSFIILIKLIGSYFILINCISLISHQVSIQRFKLVLPDSRLVFKIRVIRTTGTTATN